MNKDDEYKIAYKQVLEIIKYLPVCYYEKIPKKMIDMLKINKAENYNFEYNPNNSYKEKGKILKLNNIYKEMVLYRIISLFNI